MVDRVRLDHAAVLLQLPEVVGAGVGLSLHQEHGEGDVGLLQQVGDRGIAHHAVVDAEEDHLVGGRDPAEHRCRSRRRAGRPGWGSAAAAGRGPGPAAARVVVVVVGGTVVVGGGTVVVVVVVVVVVLVVVVVAPESSPTALIEAAAWGRRGAAGQLEGAGAEEHHQHHGGADGDAEPAPLAAVLLRTGAARRTDVVTGRHRVHGTARR